MKKAKKPTAPPPLASKDRLLRIGSILGGNAYNAISWTFGAMDVAEEELKLAYGSKEDEAAGIFSLLMPSKPLIGLDHDVYRAHVKELITRVKDGIETKSPTNAEMLAVLCTTSLKFPLNHSYVKMAEVCMEAVFPGRMPREDGRDEPNTPVLSAFEQEQFDSLKRTVQREINRGAT